MKILGLTGSIGMGKSTTAAMFEALGVPVYSADASVHRIYAGPLAQRIGDAFPGTLRDGVIDRAALSQAVVGNPDALRALEAIVHPLVREAEADFLNAARRGGHPLVVLDIPLLFETGREADMDAVLVVTAPEAVQRERVVARPDMTAQKLDAILARQMPDADKRAKADFVIDTASGLDAARTAVEAIVRHLG
ncbi:dephospho-CoA kinase [Aureimonas altamirensis]|uniref:Dephospho-CoA kinase n=1 Tax=Aureimonas altamirensis TaxID=370622 RepID=A0A0B1PY81_9HYPH|nr:dephospho-CoA kinase [Aureimonas altamirensis]KHJ53498.1 dephospho-CoA kinase [Aureimonas altamirensis]